MSSKYVFRIYRKDGDEEKVLVSRETDTSDPEAFAKGLMGLVGLLIKYRTPEKVRDIVRQHESFDNFKRMVR